MKYHNVLAISLEICHELVDFAFIHSNNHSEIFKLHVYIYTASVSNF